MARARTLSGETFPVTSEGRRRLRAPVTFIVTGLGNPFYQWLHELKAWRKEAGGAIFARFLSNPANRIRRVYLHTPRQRLPAPPQGWTEIEAGLELA